jgi:tRNA A-37 threonylcarbamoyl transferase component Bud32
MARLHVNPRYRVWLHEQGLVSGEDFLRISGVILCGHPDRHVARVIVGQGNQTVIGYLKKEHHVPWRDRMANVWAGFGLVSKSWREMVVLQQAAGAGIGCPEVIAAGEVGRRAFLLVAEVPEAIDLRGYLQRRLSRTHRSALARRLGTAVARVHRAGFDFPDLYAKHVLVVPGRHADAPSFVFIDWQRARWTARFGRRWTTLAKLDATLPAELASRDERLLCLRAYLQNRGHGKRWTGVAQAIARRSQCLRQRRQIHEMCAARLPAGSQDLLWLDGEALCVTREFHEELQGRIPNWLPLPRAWPHDGQGVERTVLTLERRRLQLVRRWTLGPVPWLAALWRGRSAQAPEVTQAATIFRLQRFGVRTPRLLAFGQRHDTSGRSASFILTEVPENASPLSRWLKQALPISSAASNSRNEVLRQAGAMCRLLHQAGYFFDRPDDLEDCLLVQPGGRNAVWLGAIDGLRRRFPLSPRRVQADLLNWHTALAPTCTRTDQLRFLLSYLNSQRLTDNVRCWIRKLLPPRIDQAHRAEASDASGPVMKGALSA